MVIDQKLERLRLLQRGSQLLDPLCLIEVKAEEPLRLTYRPKGLLGLILSNQCLRCPRQEDKAIRVSCRVDNRGGVA